MMNATDRQHNYPTQVPEWIGRHDNPYLHGIYAPVVHELESKRLEVIGELPRDLNGMHLRNGPNPLFEPRGRHHWFNGDAMIHQITFEDGAASYRNRYVETNHLRLEKRAGHALWPGYMSRPFPETPQGAGATGWLKDTGNTGIIPCGDDVLALWYQAAIPVRMDPATLARRPDDPMDSDSRRRMSAHVKIDEDTQELIFFEYGIRPPYMSYSVMSVDGSRFHTTEIPLPGARLPHDMAITKNYSILMDLPLFWDPALLEKDIHKIAFFPDLASRFAIIPRHGTHADIRWFDAEPGYMYHVVNAWEEVDEIVMLGCRVVEPCPPSPKGMTVLSRMMAFLRLDACLYEWRFNLRDGQTTERWLDDRNVEFPTINMRLHGKPSRFGYAMNLPKTPTLLFDGITRYDTSRGVSQSYSFGAGWFGSESVFAPRDNAVDEDDGYLVSFMTHATTHTSEVWVLSAKEVEAGPLARVRLPQRVPPGFHGCWIDGATSSRRQLRPSQEG